MCRCTCRSLTAPAAQEHHRQETAGLDLSPVTVLRCQGHPGNAAGPAHPPAGPCGRGPAASARAPPPARGQAHRPQKARPRRRARKPRLTATSGTTARHATGPGPGTGRAGNSRHATPALTPASRPPDPAPRATTMPGNAAARPVSRYQPTGPGVPIPTQASSAPDARHTAARPQPCHDPQPPRAVAGPLRHATGRLHLAGMLTHAQPSPRRVFRNGSRVVGASAGKPDRIFAAIEADGEAVDFAPDLPVLRVSARYGRRVHRRR
jgi:hypothetical protein